MWNLRLAESVGDGATDVVVVALDKSTLQARRRKKVQSVGINDVGTTPTRARLSVLADVSPQCRNRYTEMQRICCTPLCVRKNDIGDGQAAVQGVLTGSHDFVEGLYLEFQTYNSHGICFYVYLKSKSTLTYVDNPYSDYLDLKTAIRAK
jgi:hypothetical protein